MSANKSLKVNHKKFYLLSGIVRDPRAEVTVEGHAFIFACDEEHRPVPIAQPRSVHGQIKRTAIAHAAILFKMNLPPPKGRVPRQLRLALR